MVKASMTDKRKYVDDSIEILKALIETPSVSRDERKAADIIVKCMLRYGYDYTREGNNVWTTNRDFSPEKPTLLLNAHIDTVKPVATWERSPFKATIEDDRIYGLGSNDCGGGLVSLMQTFRIITAKEQSYNTIFLASAEEEVSGADGIRRALPLLPAIDVAIVGEPTGMRPAIAEKGLMVLDITAHGKSGHAARQEGVNAIYEILDDLNWFHTYSFPKVSDLLGPVKMSVTMINAGTQHNVVPDKCSMVVDIRTNEHYKNEEIFDFIGKNIKSQASARSFHLSSSHIDRNHPLVKRCVDMGMTPFGSPTLSDQALMSCQSLKLGPGESSRSHSADEYICISEISHAIDTYVRLLDGMDISYRR